MRAQLQAFLDAVHPLPQRIFIGVSGGLDSMVLAHALADDPRVVLVHVHHHLQPDADSWAAFVQNFARARGLVFHLQHLQTSPQPGDSIEAFARQGRYEIFEKILEADTDILLLAHHLNDQVETFFLNLKRGSGLKGLMAMPQSRSWGRGRIFRPFLNCRRTDLEAYAKACDLEYVKDPSNDDLRFERNHLRHILLPPFQDAWPHFNRHVQVAVHHLQEVGEVLDYYLEKDLLDFMEVGAISSKKSPFPEWYQQWVESRASMSFLLHQPFTLQKLLFQAWFKKVTSLILSEAHLHEVFRSFLPELDLLSAETALARLQNSRSDSLAQASGGGQLKADPFSLALAGSDSTLSQGSHFDAGSERAFLPESEDAQSARGRAMSWNDEGHLLWVQKKTREGAQPFFSLQGWDLHAYRGYFYLLKARGADFQSPRPWADFTADALSALGLDLTSLAKQGLDVQAVNWRLVTLRPRPSASTRCRPRGRVHSQTLSRCFQEQGVPAWMRDRLVYLFEGESLRMVVGAFVCD